MKKRVMKKRRVAAASSGKRLVSMAMACEYRTVKVDMKIELGLWKYIRHEAMGMVGGQRSCYSRVQILKIIDPCILLAHRNLVNAT